MRENSTTSTRLRPYNPDRANKSMRPRPTPKRKRAAHEALPPTTTVWTKGTYSTGDGEVRQLQRPGSEHAYTLPSRGYRT